MPGPRRFDAIGDWVQRGMDDMTRPSRILSRRDLDFLLFEWLDIAALTTRPRFAAHSAETFRAVLELAESLASRYFAPHNALNDVHEPQFDGQQVHVIPEVAIALKAFNESGLLSATQDESVGGAQLPHVVHRAAFAWFQAANIATAGYLLLTTASVDLLLSHGTKGQIETYVRPMLSGRFHGTMCLSEPEVGSSLGDLRTRAVLGADGGFRLHGNKMWISGGDHDLGENIVHLVLARLEGSPAGTKGLSLFIVPKILVDSDGSLGERNDVAVVGVNHKMGFRGTTNTALSFGGGGFAPGGSAGAVGYLVGERNRGLEIMFQMMNDARIGVGIGAAALGYTGYLHALDYARGRPQGRSVGTKDPTSPQVAIVEHSDVKRMLMASKTYVEGGMALSLYCAVLLDDQRTAKLQEDRKRALLLLDVLTPIAKSWPSQWCLAANDFAIQIHGGYGYSRDYPVEQFYRDNRLNPIHEGTHGVQAIDLLGRKVMMQNGAGLKLLVEVIRASVGRATGDLVQIADQLDAVVARLEATTRRLWESGDPTIALANSALYLEAAGHIVVAWLWLEQAIVACDRPGDFYAGKQAAAAYFFAHELPRIEPQLDVLDRLDTSLVELDPAWL